VLRTGGEEHETRKLFTEIRQGFPWLMRDMRLLIYVRRQLQSQARWGGRVRAPPDCKYSSLCVESEESLEEKRVQYVIWLKKLDRIDRDRRTGSQDQAAGC
jgi:hypothetical protein